MPRCRPTHVRIARPWPALVITAFVQPATPSNPANPDPPGARREPVFWVASQ